MVAAKSLERENDVPSASLISEQARRLLRNCAEVLAIVALVGGLYWYMEFINTVPDCALENHHHAGNCPVQLLAWYPKSKILTW